MKITLKWFLAALSLFLVLGGRTVFSQTCEPHQLGFDKDSDIQVDFQSQEDFTVDFPQLALTGDLAMSLEVYHPENFVKYSSLKDLDLLDLQSRTSQIMVVGKAAGVLNDKNSDFYDVSLLKNEDFAQKVFRNTKVDIDDHGNLHYERRIKKGIIDLGMVQLDGQVQTFTPPQSKKRKTYPGHLNPFLLRDQNLKKTLGSPQKIFSVKINEDPTAGPSYGGQLTIKIYPLGDTHTLFVAYYLLAAPKGKFGWIPALETIIKKIATSRLKSSMKKLVTYVREYEDSTPKK